MAGVFWSGTISTGAGRQGWSRPWNAAAKDGVQGPGTWMPGRAGGLSELRPRIRVAPALPDQSCTCVNVTASRGHPAPAGDLRAEAPEGVFYFDVPSGRDRAAGSAKRGAGGVNRSCGYAAAAAAGGV